MKYVVSLFMLALCLFTAKAQVPNSDCGEVWVVFFRCVADPQCGPGQKFCTWVFNSEFCGSWDARGCWPGPGNVAELGTCSTKQAAQIVTRQKAKNAAQVKKVLG